MTQRICSVEECDGRATRRGWCTKHYQRWRAHGDPLTFRPDATRGCSIQGCEGAHYGRGWCQMHHARWVKTGDPTKTRPHFSPLAGLSGSANPQWVGDDAGYEAVHARLRKDHGPATGYTCEHCGGQADEWAYDHEDPNERRAPSGLRYSTSGRRHYVPLCRPCHRTFDLSPETRQEAAPVR